MADPSRRVRGSPGHLLRRFAFTLRARRPRPADQAWVAATLPQDLAEVFFAQPAPDQAHGLSCARAVRAANPDRDDLAAAALLHDVGKRHARLGALGRSLATALEAIRVPRTKRMQLYLDHGRLGADELEALGAEALLVEFARHHHGRKPDGISDSDWELLVAADAE